jgi:hypothetical protein
MRLQKNCADPIVLTLKSRGADSSVLTVGVRKICDGILVRTLGTACRCVGRMNPHMPWTMDDRIGKTCHENAKNVEEVRIGGAEHRQECLCHKDQVE